MIRLNADDTPRDEVTMEKVAAYKRALATINALADLRGISEAERNSMTMGDLIHALGGHIGPGGSITLPDPWEGGA